MALTKNSALRYRILDECLGNPGRHYTFEDLKETINTAIIEINPNWGGISDRQLRYDLKYLEDFYNAPLMIMKEGRKRFYLYENQAHFSIFHNPLSKSEKDHAQARAVLPALYRESQRERSCDRLRRKAKLSQASRASMADQAARRRARCGAAEESGRQT